MIGSVVKVIVDRPLGSYHPTHKNDAKKKQIIGISSRNKNRAFYIKAVID